jgi:hypothetical protein
MQYILDCVNILDFTKPGNSRTIIVYNTNNLKKSRKMEDNKEAIEKVKWLIKAGREKFFKVLKSIPIQSTPKLEQEVFASYFANGYAQGFSHGETMRRDATIMDMLDLDYTLEQIMAVTHVSADYIDHLVGKKIEKEDNL